MSDSTRSTDLVIIDLQPAAAQLREQPSSSFYRHGAWCRALYLLSVLEHELDQVKHAAWDPRPDVVALRAQALVCAVLWTEISDAAGADVRAPALAVEQHVVKRLERLLAAGDTLRAKLVNEPTVNAVAELGDLADALRATRAAAFSSAR